ncbi:hypothetical protein [Mucilaginibacter ginsenosidivorax]|uniref:Uncharacterized protein n=1 Tax=Mucilaginibacter ginsenosidivorax TaxID=862126 RepID=A0A5B8VV63_9SPHI|nr:hypothetical protein [Mucilaginibacter ginsenosidivorax]QEC75289.1 hypothetical protein FSB76_04795 [Mucilaginibacter ginsenosidivorax]
MQSKTLLILLLIASPFLCSAQQGAATYTANFRGQQIKLNLANGFSGASQIQMGSVTYYANSGHPDASNHLMFQSRYIQKIEYFVLSNMHDSYDKLPAFINGKYYRGRNAVSIRFKLDK